ncbi:FkbM family methyltransferase [Roseovarius spongiae]|uniref:FkbM family methyltransferase n=1 Tax=Roseovarius spongiae TaxID=2320272 RepID=UPI0014088CC7|nr:FkbM family methyltransferase [Roseovarius spongiae]
MKTFLKRAVPAGLRRYAAEKKRSRARAALRRIAARGVEVATVIDVGASDGRWSVQTMDYFPDADYLLIEANPVHRTALEEFCAARRNARFELAAASDIDGEVAFDGSDPFGGAADPQRTEATLRARAVRLDSLCQADGKHAGPYFLKLDTHGYEVPILNGSEHILANASLVVIEVYVFRLSSDALLFDEMVALMREKGFGVVDMSDPLWRPGDGCFWQMDIYFEPLSAPVFRRQTYS